MRHDPRFATFFSAYLNENAQFDLQNAFLEEEKQEQLFKLFAFVSLTRDTRAVRNMVPDEVWANVPPDPTIAALEAERSALKEGSYRIAGRSNEARIRMLTKEIGARRVERDRRIVKDYREYYFYHRPTWDIEAQARGEKEEEYREPIIDVAFPERARLAEIFCHQPRKLNEKELLNLRVEAIDLMVSLCDKKETARSSQRRPEQEEEAFIKDELAESDPASDNVEADLFPLLLDPTQCPDCIGDGGLSVEERTFRWCRPTVRNDHFDDRHLPEREAMENSGGSILCRHTKCVEIKFKHMDHFRKHVQDVHGISLRTSHQARERRSRKLQRRRMAHGRAINKHEQRAFF